MPQRPPHARGSRRFSGFAGHVAPARFLGIICVEVPDPGTARRLFGGKAQKSEKRVVGVQYPALARVHDARRQVLHQGAEQRFGLLHQFPDEYRRTQRFGSRYHDVGIEENVAKVECRRQKESPVAPLRPGSTRIPRRLSFARAPPFQIFPGFQVLASRSIPSVQSVRSAPLSALIMSLFGNTAQWLAPSRRDHDQGLMYT